VLILIEHLEKKKRKTLKVLANIWLNANIDSHTFINSRYWIDNYSNMLKSVKEANIYVYKKNNLIVAFCGLEGNYIKGLFVKTEHRNEGIGTALMHHLMTIHAELTLKVFAENKKAVHFYEKLGFVTVDTNIDTLDNKELLMKWTKPTTE